MTRTARKATTNPWNVVGVFHRTFTPNLIVLILVVQVSRCEAEPKPSVCERIPTSIAGLMNVTCTLGRRHICLEIHSTGSSSYPFFTAQSYFCNKLSPFWITVLPCSSPLIVASPLLLRYARTLCLLLSSPLWVAAISSTLHHCLLFSLTLDHCPPLSFTLDHYCPVVSSTSMSLHSFRHHCELLPSFLHLRNPSL